MILVTVGTTMAFDAMVREIDNLVGTKKIQEEVVCQIGPGKFVPKHCKYFRFRPSIDDLLEEADIVVSHGGSTVFSLIRMGKKCVIIPNPDAADSHQLDLMRMLSKRIEICWSEDVKDLRQLIERSKSAAINHTSKNHLADDLFMYLQGIILNP